MLSYLIYTLLQAVRDKEETLQEAGAHSILTPSSLFVREAITTEDDDVVTSRLPRGYTLLKIARGGDCMFRALARLCYGVESEHTKLRRDVVEYVVCNWERMQWGFTENTATKYKERMLNTKHVDIGNENEIFAAARLLGRRIIVLTIDATESELPMTKREYLPVDTEHDISLRLVHVNKNHYHAGIHTYKLTRQFYIVHSFISCSSSSH